MTEDFNTMLKCFCWHVALSVVLDLLMTQVALSRSISEDYQYPEVKKTDVDIPVCYIQTADGTILNLQKLCQEVSPGSNRLSPNSNSSSQVYPGVPSFRRGVGGRYASDSRFKILKSK